MFKCPFKLDINAFKRTSYFDPKYPSLHQYSGPHEVLFQSNISPFSKGILPPSLPPWPIPAAVSVRPFNSRLPLFLSPLGSQHHRKSTKFLHFLTPLSFFFTVMNKLTLLLNSALWDPLPINMNTLCGCLLSHSIRCFPAPGAKATPLPRSFLRSSPACLSALLL